MEDLTNPNHEASMKKLSLLETSIREEEDLKDRRYTQLENKEKEMMAQLEVLQLHFSSPFLGYWKIKQIFIDWFSILF